MKKIIKEGLICLGVCCQTMTVALARPVASELAPCTNAYDSRLNLELTFGLSYSQVPGTLAQTTHSVRVENKHYRIDSVNQARGLLAMVYSGDMVIKSEGFFSAKGGFDPIYYSERRGNKKLRETVVDAETKTVMFKRNDATMPWQVGVQDRLTLMYQLSSLLQCNGVAEEKKATFPVMTTKTIETEVFEYVNTEKIDVWLGDKKKTLDAVRFDNNPSSPKDDKIRVWYAKKQKFLPLKLEVEDDEGKVVTQILTGYKVIEPAS